MRSAPVVVVLVLFAGCMGGSSGLRSTPAPSASHGAETGGVEGLVVDPEFRPIEAATVVLIGAHVSVNTTAEGRFAISDLAPQQYLAVVTRPGFVDAKHGFEVPLGNVTRVRIVLQPVPPPTPWIDSSKTFNGVVRMGYSYRAAQVSGNSSGSSGAAVPESARSTPSQHLRFDPHWQTILFEIDWEPASDQSDQMAMQVTWAQKASNGGTSLTNKQWVVGGEPPLRWRLDRSVYDEMAKANPQLLSGLHYGLPFLIGPSTDPAQPVDIGLYPDQPYSVLVSVGYYGSIPADFTRLAP